MTHLFRTPSTSRRLYLMLVALLIILAVASILLFDRIRQDQEQAFDRRAESIIQSLGDLGGHFIATFDWPLVEKLVSGAGGDPVITSVQIKDFLSEQTFGRLETGSGYDLKTYTREIVEDGISVGRINIVFDDTLLQQTLDWLRHFLGFSVAVLAIFFVGFTGILIQTKKCRDDRARGQGTPQD